MVVGRVENDRFIHFDPGADDGSLDDHQEQEVDIRQMEKNGITIIDFDNPPEGIVLLDKPFYADSLWRNMSESPLSRKRS